MLDRGFNQTATYWSPTGANDKYGKPTLNSPVQITCRWEERQTQIMSKMGVLTISKARIFTKSAIDMDGYLALGTHTEADPRPLDTAFQVQQVSSMPNLRNLQSLTTVYL